MQLNELEMHKLEMIDEMDRIRSKAHSMLRDKDKQLKHEKLLISKYH
jgi:hypothetical protein